MSNREGPNLNKVQNISKLFPVNYRVRKRWRGSVSCIKITMDKVLGADLTKREGHSQLRRESQVGRENESQPNVDVIIQKTRGSRSKVRHDTRAAYCM